MRGEPLRLIYGHDLNPISRLLNILSGIIGLIPGCPDSVRKGKTIMIPL